MEEFYRNRVLNYGYLASMTLLAIILLFIVFEGNYKKFTGSIDLSDFSIKLVLILVITATYITLVTPSFKVLGENKVLKKTPPRGDRGSRGNRGTLGKDSVCNECGDDLCYKKIMYTITKTINLWRQHNNMERLDDNYVIENDYIKDRALKHCGSKQFKKLLNKYGSNNKKNVMDDNNSPMCPKDIRELGLEKDNAYGCGAYDYMLKMWSIWILIILRYKNGMLFLESSGLNENDFVGMIEKEDGFELGAKVKDGNNEYEVIDNSEFPFFTLRNDNNQTKTEYINKLSRHSSGSGTTWDSMFGGDLTLTVKQRIIMLGQVLLNEDTYIMDGINNGFISVIGNTPGGGKTSPFDEIKKYSSWYWGAEAATKPRFVIEKTAPNKVCPTCKNSSLCDPSNNSGGIKVKFTNSLKKLVDLSTISSKSIVDSEFYVPFGKLTGRDFNYGNSQDTASELNVSIFRPETIIDDSESHNFFKEYKPVGDVLLKNTDFILDSTELSKCFPKEGPYNDDLITPVIGDGYKNVEPISDDIAAFKNHDHIYTMLVAGDTRPPEDFTLIARYVKNKGFKKNSEGITIWKPEAPEGYIALGFVIDIRPSFDPDPDPDPNSVNDNKPPRDIIATVPEASLKELQLSYFENKAFLTNVNVTTNINTFLDDTHKTLIETAATDPTGNILCQPMGYASDTISTQQVVESSADSEPINALFKNKKYSLQKIYDNNNE